MKLQLEPYDRICFLGDSITQNGQWIAEIFEYFKENLPELKIGLYNCGIAGTSAWSIHQKNRIFCDCLNLFPKYTVVMFGMNDIGRHLYDGSMDEEMLKLRQDRMNLFKKSLEEIVQFCKQAGSTPILCSPTLYDEYTEPQDSVGLDRALEQCTAIVEKICKENDLLFVNMRNVLMQHMNQKPIGLDRVHPNAFGQHLLAECFLYSVGLKNAMEPDKVIVLKGESEARYEVEQMLRKVVFVERNLMGWQNMEEDIPVAKRKELVKKRLENEETERFAVVLKQYLELSDFKEKLRGEVVKKTIEMYRR